MTWTPCHKTETGQILMGLKGSFPKAKSAQHRFREGHPPHIHQLFFALLACLGHLARLALFRKLGLISNYVNLFFPFMLYPRNTTFTDIRSHSAQ